MKNKKKVMMKKVLKYMKNLLRRNNDEESPQVHEEPPHISIDDLQEDLVDVRVLKHPFLLHIRQGFGNL
jgi:hypothetical protein